MRLKCKGWKFVLYLSLYMCLYLCLYYLFVFVFVSPFEWVRGGGVVQCRGLGAACPRQLHRRIRRRRRIRSRMRRRRRRRWRRRRRRRRQRKWAPLGIVCTDENVNIWYNFSSNSYFLKTYLGNVNSKCAFYTWGSKKHGSKMKILQLFELDNIHSVFSSWLWHFFDLGFIFFLIFV